MPFANIAASVPVVVDDDKCIADKGCTSASMSARSTCSRSMTEQGQGLHEVRRVLVLHALRGGLPDRRGHGQHSLSAAVAQSMALSNFEFRPRRASPRAARRRRRRAARGRDRTGGSHRRTRSPAAGQGLRDADRRARGRGQGARRARRGGSGRCAGRRARGPGCGGAAERGGNAGGKEGRCERGALIARSTIPRRSCVPRRYARCANW